MQDETQKTREGQDNNFKRFHILAEMTDMREGFVLADSPWYERRTAVF